MLIYVIMASHLCDLGRDLVRLRLERPELTALPLLCITGAAILWLATSAAAAAAPRRSDRLLVLE